MRRTRRRRSSQPAAAPVRRISYRKAPRPGGAAHAGESPDARPPATLKRAPSRPPRAGVHAPSLHASLTAERVDLTLPLPPSVNHQYATVNGRRVLSARGRGFKQLVAQRILVALARLPGRERWLHAFQTTFLGLTVRLHVPSLLLRDVDGGLKITQDALCEALGINDNRILHIHLVKALDPLLPRMEVSLFRQASGNEQ